MGLNGGLLQIYLLAVHIFKMNQWDSICISMFIYQFLLTNDVNRVSVFHICIQTHTTWHWTNVKLQDNLC